jgi:hypothetical protein
MAKSKKFCIRCKKIKNINKYYIDKAHKDGLSTHCKDCQRLYTKEYYIENIEWYRQYAVNQYKKRKLEKSC